MTITINGTTGITTPEVVLDNTAADGGQVVLKSSGYSNWNWDNYSGNLRAYYGSTEAMRIDSSGNVGIGTSSPAAKLHVAQNGGGAVISAATASAANVYIAGNGNTAGSTSFDLIQDATTVYVYNRANTPMVFGTNNTERMRIDYSGNLLVGTTTATGRISIANGIGFYCTSAQAVNQSGVYYFHEFKLGTGSQVGSIQSNGTTTSYLTSSDYRLKENIQPMQNALGVVAQLNPVTYTWKADGSDGQGFIAHELQAVVPDCVTGEKDAVRIVDVLDDEGKVIGTKEEPVYQGIDTSFLVATLCKAIQELKAEVDELKAKVNV